jgi:rod shape-determining protein MreC
MRRKSNTTFVNKYVAIVLTLICIILMGISYFSEHADGSFTTIANFTVVPMQKGINTVGLRISEFQSNFASLKETQAENLKLQEQVAQLTEENNRLQQSTYELNRLQSLYELDQQYPQYEKVGANVIAKDSGSWFSTFVIDKGSDDGIQKDMNVLADGGLAGIVTRVGKNHATVRSIIDDTSNVSAMSATTSDVCIVSGDLTLMDTGNISFSQMANNDNEINVGDKIVTSHISSKYVEGLLVGYISEITIDSNNLTRSGKITPAVDFKNLQEVLVITTLKDDGSNDTGE